MDTSLDTILLAVGPRDEDRLELLARTVLQVAKPTGATVVLTHVFTGEQFQEVAEELDYPNAMAEDMDVIIERHESVRYFEDVFDDHDVDHEARGVIGDVSENLVQMARVTDADRVVISGRSTSPIGKAVFGSTAQSVLLESPCPVTYVRRQANED
jgi:nucleotide-binding universal stress UspA family protein